MRKKKADLLSQACLVFRVAPGGQPPTTCVEVRGSADMGLRSSHTEAAMATKQTGNKASTIAGKVLGGAKPTQAQVKTLAASVLSQDEKKGRR